MSCPVTKKIRVLKAEYVKEADSIVILGECDEGQTRAQINKSSFNFGSRTEAEIDYEMEKTAYLMENKTINIEFTDSIEDYDVKSGKKRSEIMEDRYGEMMERLRSGT